jgi:cellulose synthase/poly-beta-1,6-N-acetylglucosamine synthase-like glycosyltransferase
MIALGLFWSAAALLAWTYAVFPVLLLARGRLARRPYRTGEITPLVSVLIAARNEAGVIGSKLESLLRLDYPAEKLEIVVASDGSTDATAQVVATYADRGVRLLTLPADGKAAALNAAVEASRGELLVFSDANSEFAPTALRALVRPFADPGVGGVAGNQVYSGSARDGTATGERSYWHLDRRLKEAESAAGSAISATGAIYAIRRSLFAPVPVGVTDDFATSTRVVSEGYRLVFAPDAIAYEAVADSTGREFARKVRVMTRGMRGVVVMRHLLDPRRYGFYSFQLAWHKVLRRLMAIPLIILAVATLALRGRGPIYRAAAVGQGAFYAAAVGGLLLGRTRIGRGRLLSLPAYLVMVNAASLVALLNVITGRRIDHWNPARSASPADEPRRT